jgi:NADH:ubiquinone oxidoreductase subunit 5 (subunit L)/multisubunit Na+/H+ antiporter MnhA subunit
MRAPDQAVGQHRRLPGDSWCRSRWSSSSTAPGLSVRRTGPWIPFIGASYHLGIDGLGLLLVMLTTLLGLIAILSSWNAITTRLKEYYAFFLLLQTAMLGVFMSLDFLLFFVFWEPCWCRCTSSSPSGAASAAATRPSSSSFIR